MMSNNNNKNNGGTEKCLDEKNYIISLKMKLKINVDNRAFVWFVGFLADCDTIQIKWKIKLNLI